MADIVFGRYIDNRTVVHRVDPRIKIALLILLYVTIFLQFTLWSTNLIISGVLVILLFALMLLSKVSILSLFKSLASMWIMILILLVIYIFVPNNAYNGTAIAFTIGTYNVYWAAFYQCFYIILRLVMMVMITMVLTTTTKPMDLTQGLEWGMSPLKVIHFPAHEIAMTISIALRFIPTILEETSRIIKAQTSRGANFTNGNIFKRFGALVSLIIPLFVNAIERSDQLAIAMEARGYDPKAKRTHYHKLSLHLCDLFSSLIVLLVFGGVLTLFIIDHNVVVVDVIKVVFGVNVGF